MTTEEVVVGDWRFTKSNKERGFPESAVQEILRILPRWSQVFPKENTWVSHACGIPSLLVRVDCVLNRAGDLNLYEIEDRPAGIGVSCLTNPAFQEKLEGVKKTWPPIVVVLSPKRPEGDDHIWTRVVELGEINLPTNSKVLVRAEPEEEEFWHLAGRSISTIKTEGDKSYGITLGWWKPVPSNPEELPWATGFVLKPARGSKCQGLEIWPSPEIRKVTGTSTRSRVLRTLNDNNGNYIYQPFFTPMRDERSHWWMYRVFFAWDLVKKEWTYLGGCWNSRPNLRLHGAQDAVFGPVD